MHSVTDSQMEARNLEWGSTTVKRMLETRPIVPQDDQKQGAGLFTSPDMGYPLQNPCRTKTDMC